MNAIRGERYQYSIAEMGSKTKRAALSGKSGFSARGLKPPRPLPITSYLTLSFFMVHPGSARARIPCPGLKSRIAVKLSFERGFLYRSGKIDAQGDEAKRRDQAFPHPGPLPEGEGIQKNQGEIGT